MPDFVVANRIGRVVLRSGPHAAGGTVVEIPLPTAPFEDAVSAAAGDINGDGHADVVLGGFVGAGYVALGDGRGGFSAASATFPGGGNFLDVATADLNNDGFDDVVLGPTDALNIAVLLYKPTVEERARTATGSLTRIETAIDGVAGTLESMANTLTTLQMPNLEKLSALDVPVSSRASQDSVNTLNLNVLGAAVVIDQKLNTLVSGMTERDAALDAPVSSRASALAISDLNTRLDSLITGATERLEAVMLRVSIEQALSKGDRLSSFYLPEEHGGILGRVRQVLVEASERNEAAGLSINKARTLLGDGDTLMTSRTDPRNKNDGKFLARKYRLVFDSYAQAYQALVK